MESQSVKTQCPWPSGFRHGRVILCAIAACLLRREPVAGQTGEAVPRDSLLVDLQKSASAAIEVLDWIAEYPACASAARNYVAKPTELTSHRAVLDALNNPVDALELREGVVDVLAFLEAAPSLDITALRKMVQTMEAHFLPISPGLMRPGLMAYLPWAQLWKAAIPA